MTELQAEMEIRAYERRKREMRNRELLLGMRNDKTAEHFLKALHSLEGLNTAVRERARQPKILQILA